MAKANKSRYAILGILAASPKSSGYDIQSNMKESTDFFWKETFSSIYPVLDALEKENLIIEVEGTTSGRKRKAYSITKKGFVVLQNWLMEDVEIEQPRNELSLKVFFGQFISPESSIQKIKNYKEKILVKKSILEKTKQMLTKDYTKDPALPFWLMTIEFGLIRMQASIDWSEYALKKLSKIATGK